MDRDSTRVLIGSVVLAAAVTLPAAAQRRLPFFGALDASRPVPYFIADGASVDGYRPGDRTLAGWALAAWQQATGGTLRLEPGAEHVSLIRLHWIQPSGGLYGEMRPILVSGRRGAIVFVIPQTDALGPEVAARARRDPLFRDSVVYLACLHELGHGLGLEHTANYDDIMYFFGHGGDVPGYFQRYRDRLTARTDIQHVPGLSPNDVRRLRALYAPHTAG